MFKAIFVIFKAIGVVSCCFTVIYIAISVRNKIFGYKTTKKERIKLTGYCTIIAVIIYLLESILEFYVK